MRNAEVRSLLDDEREAPTRLMYLFYAFVELCRSRRSGFNGPEALGYDQIYYWSLTIGYPLLRWEVDVIYRIDGLWRERFVPKPESTKRKLEAVPNANG
ncbi:MAG TPA: hypothetical protein VFN64_03865 [Burkholderiaceae bacterium]|nr:hypothetical protein [Burkholderiaceae bacterium]